MSHCGTDHLRVLIANERRDRALGLARLAQQAAPLTAVLTLGESGASNRRHLHDHRGAAPDAPTDVP